MGRSGRAAARLARERGYRVALYDDLPQDAWDEGFADEASRTGMSVLDRLEDAGRMEIGEIVVSPGVPFGRERFTALRGVPAVSEPGFAWRWLEGPAVAVTGTNGKSTTVALVRELLEHSGMRAVSCGNFGTPLSEIVRDADSVRTVKVIELSSFQLEMMEGADPDVAACLPVTEDHLNRYADFGEYENAKMNLFRKNAFRAHRVIAGSLLRRHPDLERSGKTTVVERDRTHGEAMLAWTGNAIRDERGNAYRLNGTVLEAPHNRENCLFALAIAGFLADSRGRWQEALRAFRGLPYRQSEIDGGADFPRVMNDSKSTSPDSTIKALDAFGEPAVLILGGRNKNHTFRGLVERLKGSSVRAVAFGESREFLKRTLAPVVPVQTAPTLGEAVDRAMEWALNGSGILFSPGCESFDQFDGYRERGERFDRIIVRKIKERKQKTNKGGNV
jgi:UDP-N-acetylmuramoylalanine--D-glutamate ligase